MDTTNRVAINTLVQYVQLLLNVIIGLFSVRVILNALGASDYGIYDLIGGVVALFTFISTSLSQTSMRFLSVSLGEGDDEKTRKVFSTCLWLHIFIAFLIAAILVILGFFIFDGFLNIPEERVSIARMLYYFMVIGLFLNISVTPFSAMIAAHERFVYISCVQILDSILKLVIAFIIMITYYDKLLLYGVLMMGIIVVNVLCYVFFVNLKYREKISLHRASFSDMKLVTGFAGWTLLDVLGSIATRQGYAILINTFFGTIANAVFALARQIEGHMYTISASVINTIKPQIMKSYGAGEIDRMFRLSLTAGKFGFSMMSLIAIPLLVMMPEVLSLWLKNVPEGTVLFSRLMITACMFEQLTRGLVYANQAVGNIKWFSITISSIRFLALPVSWLLFFFGAPSYAAIIVFLVCETIGSLSRVYILSKISNFKASAFIHSVFLQLLPPFIISLFVCMVCYSVMNGIWGIIFVSIITAICYMVMVYLLALTKDEKKSVSRLIASFTHGKLTFLGNK